MSTFFGAPFREFENIGGVHLADSVLWCDADRKSGLNFLSAAGAASPRRGRRVLCTPATQHLGLGRAWPQVLTAPYDQALSVGALQCSLHPSGSLLGAAQLLVLREGRRIVYAGDVCPRPSLSCPQAESIRCDVLALSATYASRLYQFPPQEEVWKNIYRFVDGTLASKGNPVFLVQALGSSMELMMGLGRQGYKLRVHRALAEVAKGYASFSVAMPPFRRMGKRIGKEDVLLVPPILRAEIKEAVPEARVSVVGPRAVEAPYVHQLGVVEAFPLSNVADSNELLSFIRSTGAKEVFVTEGPAAELSEVLGQEGVVVRDLLPQQQLSLF